jgi:hypothetical protein
MQIVWFPGQKYSNLTDIKPISPQILQKDAKERSLSH